MGNVLQMNSQIINENSLINIKILFLIKNDIFHGFALVIFLSTSFIGAIEEHPTASPETTPSPAASPAPSGSPSASARSVVASPTPSRSISKAPSGSATSDRPPASDAAQLLQTIVDKLGRNQTKAHYQKGHVSTSAEFIPWPFIERS